MFYDLNYRKIGSSPKTFVFVHGLMGYWRNFYSISQAFKKHYTCILYDQRGHGLSFHKEPYTVEELALDLRQLLEHLKVQKPVVLLGHSLGAYVSSCFAYQHADCLEQLILVDASPWPKKEKAQELSKILELLPRSFESQSQAKSFFEKAVLENCFSTAVAQFLMGSLEKPSKGKVHFLFDKKGLLKLLKAVREWDHPLMLKSLKAPTLFLRGEHSTHFPEEDFQKTLKLNPLIQGVEIKGSGHWIHAEQPQAFIKSLKDFLNPSD